MYHFLKSQMIAFCKSSDFPLYFSCSEKKLSHFKFFKVKKKVTIKKPQAFNLRLLLLKRI